MHILNHLRRAVVFGVLLNFVSILSVHPTCTAAAEPISFGRDILPILSDHCFHCHGPDGKNRAADLRLDAREGATRADSPAIIPGNSAESELVRRVRSTDPDVVMPPPQANRKLTPAQTELLAKWIDAGAPWGKHWAFERPERPAIPAVKNSSWVRNPIDAFILARLEREGLAPSPEASRETLLRRVSLDLTGLPPTLAELDAFLADPTPHAYEAAVDRLLKSPRYGERMVWDWLDAARYADTNGYQGDPTRAMWFWRDWVIDALNENMPFDRFTIEQLAGDLLPSPSQSQLIATGFHRNHMINGEGGRIAEESRVDYVQDRVETTGTVWLGLTLNCCRCHDHKYDPISQREYYQLAAYFNSIDENGGADAHPHGRPVLRVMTPEVERRIAALKARESELDQAVNAAEKAAREDLAAWETAARDGKSPTWTWLKPTQASSSEGATATIVDEGHVLISGKNPAQDDLIAVFAGAPSGITGLRLEALPDPSLVNQGPGRADNGNFVLSELKATWNDLPMVLRNAKVDFGQEGWPAANVLDGKNDTGWAVMPAFGKSHQWTAEATAPVGDDKPGVLVIRLEHRTSHVAHVLGRFRMAVTTTPAAQWTELPEAVRAALGIAADQRTDAQRRAVLDHYLATHVAVAAARQQRDATRKNREQAEKDVPTTMVMRDRTEPRETNILVRGAWDKPSEKVTHGVPGALPRLPPDAPAHRLSLARWLVAPENPLTARVTVNRYWQLFFGNGIVKTTEDFGVQSERPMHPDLLDWLACEFREPTMTQPTVALPGDRQAWNVKHLHRLIVTSAAYRQSSRISVGLQERDPDNRLLARGPRYRLPSWMIRDQALAASGLLVEKTGGPPVKGYQPPGIWEEATFGFIKYAQDRGDALYRRSVYQFWRRIVGPTVFFDVANRQTCTVKVSRTNTPLHALVTLNDVTFVEAARALGQRVLVGTASDDAGRVSEAFRLCTSRSPTSTELELLLKRLALLREAYGKDRTAAGKLIAMGESQADSRLDAADLAAYTGIALVIMNLDETLSKE